MGGYADGKGTLALFNYPISLAISQDGASIFVSDSNNNVIRKIKVSNRDVTTLAGVPRSQRNPFLGDFLDGSSEQARFNDPQVLAMACAK